MATLYPWGYQRALVELSRLKELARWDLLEDETGERVEAWLFSRDGQIGIGGAVRFVQPDKDGFAPPGMSFHELQTFHTGLKRYCAFDLVVRNGSNVHRSPTWAEVPKQGSGHPDIAKFGVHCNVPGEPWHMQPIEIDGWSTWDKNGRPHPNGNFPIGGVPQPPPPPPKDTYALGERTLRLSSPPMKGNDVFWVQNVLKGQGLVLSADSYYGLQTFTRVKTMQGWNGLTQDGVVGPQTWEVLKKY
jgi:Putative peptidoglycan-binding domain-containing protein